MFPPSARRLGPRCLTSNHDRSLSAIPCNAKAAAVLALREAGDRPDVAEAVAIGGLLGGQRLLAQIVRQMRQKLLPDHLVRGAHDAGHIFGAIEPDPMRREGALKRDEMLGVGIDERAVEIEEKG
jgi:hypothetical protein